MGWFDEQIRQRQQNDDDYFSESFANIACAVMGLKILSTLNNRKLNHYSLDAILKYYHVKSREIPENITDMNEQLEFLMRPYGIMRRTVRLEDGWYKDAIGAMLAVRKSDGSVVALIPKGISGYCYLDNESGEKIRVNSKNQHLFETEAIAFYKPFPLKKIGISDLLLYIVRTLSLADFAMLSFVTLVVTILGILITKFNNILFSDVIGSGSIQLLAAVAIFMICVTISQMIFTVVKELITARINTKMSIFVQAATMMRILSLPASFFKQYSSGELLSRSQCIHSLCDLIVSTILSTGLTSVFSLIYMI